MNGTVGFSISIAIHFCIGDLDADLNTDYLYPFIEDLLQATRSRRGSAVISLIMDVPSAARELLFQNVVNVSKTRLAQRLQSCLRTWGHRRGTVY